MTSDLDEPIAGAEAGGLGRGAREHRGDPRASWAIAVEPHTDEGPRRATGRRLGLGSRGSGQDRTTGHKGEDHSVRYRIEA